MLDTVAIGGFIGAVIAGGVAAWQARKGAGAVETKTDDQTRLLTETLGAVVNMGRDVSDIKRNADGIVQQVGGLQKSVDDLRAGHIKHGERIGELERHIRKEA